MKKTNSSWEKIYTKYINRQFKEKIRMTIRKHVHSLKSGYYISNKYFSLLKKKSEYTEEVGNSEI